MVCDTMTNAVQSFGRRHSLRACSFDSTCWLCVVLYIDSQYFWSATFKGRTKRNFLFEIFWRVDRKIWRFHQRVKFGPVRYQRTCDRNRVGSGQSPYGLLGALNNLLHDCGKWFIRRILNLLQFRKPLHYQTLEFFKGDRVSLFTWDTCL